MEGLDRERLEGEFYALRRPVLMKGAAASWPAMASWTPGHFAARYGDLAITPSVGLPATEVPYQYRDRDFRQPMTVRQFVERLHSGDRCYIDQMDARAFEGLQANFDFGMFGPDDVKVIALWLGAHTCSGLHYDWVDNLFAQVYGTKTVILASPESAPNIYPFPDSYCKSQVAPQHPDFAAFPRFRNVTRFEGVMEPGDVLYIPRGWWHYFAAQGVSISLSCWYGEQLTPGHELKVVLSMRSPKLLARTVRDFVWHGLLNKPYQNRLYSLPPTGRMVYEILSSQLRRWRT